MLPPALKPKSAASGSPNYESPLLPSGSNFTESQPWSERHGQRDVDATVGPMRPCNFSEEGDEYEMQGDYHGYQRNDDAEIAWQHHLNHCIDDQLMVGVAKAAVEEAKARAKEDGIDVPEFTKAKMKGNGEDSKWFEGTKPGMIFKHGSQGLCHYKDGAVRTLELAREILPMQGCTPMKLMISELLEATPKEAKEDSPKTTPATVKERLTRRNPTPNGPDDLSWADDSSLSVISKQHWFGGCGPSTRATQTHGLGPTSTLREPRRTSWPSKKQR